MSVETEDPFHSVLSHDGEMDGIPRCQFGMADDDVSSTLGDLEINREHLVDDLQQDFEARLNSVAAVNRDIAVKNLLQDLGIGDEALFFGDGTFEKTTSVDLVRMLPADQVHRDVGVHQDHSLSP